MIMAIIIVTLVAAWCLWWNIKDARPKGRSEYRYGSWCPACQHQHVDNGDVCTYCYWNDTLLEFVYPNQKTVTGRMYNNGRFMPLDTVDNWEATLGSMGSIARDRERLMMEEQARAEATRQQEEARAQREQREATQIINDALSDIPEEQMPTITSTSGAGTVTWYIDSNHALQPLGPNPPQPQQQAVTSGYSQTALGGNQGPIGTYVTSNSGMIIQSMVDQNKLLQPIKKMVEEKTTERPPSKRRIKL